MLVVVLHWNTVKPLVCCIQVKHILQVLQISLPTLEYLIWTLSLGEDGIKFSRIQLLLRFFMPLWFWRARLAAQHQWGLLVHKRVVIIPSIRDSCSASVLDSELKADPDPCQSNELTERSLLRFPNPSSSSIYTTLRFIYVGLNGLMQTVFHCTDVLDNTTLPKQQI